MKSKTKPVGRPPVADHLKKEQIGVKLPRWLIKWMRKQTVSNAVLIEDALRQAHDLKAP